MSDVEEVPMDDPVDDTPVERRDPDQDAAIEAAFVAGVLPEEDRRHVFEWARRGDGVEELYVDGQRCADPDVIAQQHAIREASR